MSLDRITNRKLLDDLMNLFNLKRGIPFTIWKIILDPGKAVKMYLFEDRTKYVNSFRMLSVVVAISTFALYKFEFFEGINFNVGASDVEPAQSELKSNTSQYVGKVLQEYMYWLNFLMVPFIAAFTHLFFRKSNLNFAEHATAQAYILSAVTAIGIISLPISLYSKNLYLTFALLVTIVFQIRFCLSLESKKALGKRIGAAIFSYALAYFVYSIFMMFLVGIIVGFRLAKAGALP